MHNAFFTHQMLSTTKWIYNKIWKHLSNYTTTIIHLRSGEYYGIIPSISSQLFFINIHFAFGEQLLNNIKSNRRRMLPTSSPISCVEANVQPRKGSFKNEKSFSYGWLPWSSNLLGEQALKSYIICHQNMTYSVAYILNRI